MVISRHNFMGCPIDSYSLDGAVTEALARIKSRGPTNLIHFLNVAKVVKARENDCLRKALWDGDFVLADGKPLLFFGRGLGIRLPTRVNGTDLMEKLLEACANEGFSIYLFGAKQDVIVKCVDSLREKYQNIKIVGYRNGYFKENEIDELIFKINKSTPDILFIGLPTPLKELFAYKNRDKLRVPVVQGVGGSFDVLAGLVKRAPKWMQNYGLEWFYRILQEPKRLIWRYFSTNIRFILLYIKQFLANLNGTKQIKDYTGLK